MCDIAKRLLAEKLIDDFREEAFEWPERPEKTDLTEQLKHLVPPESWDVLFRWEAAASEDCGEELRRFSEHVATVMLMGCHFPAEES